MNYEESNVYRINNIIEKIIFNKNQSIRDDILLGEVKVIPLGDKNEYANNDIIVNNMMKHFIIESTICKKKELVN